jgi:hypothetical protein
MKMTIAKKFLLLPLLFIAGTIIAQQSTQSAIPPAIPLQAVAKDALGNPAKNRKVFIKDAIYQGGINGTLVWEETFEVTTDNDGIYTINIGLGTRPTNSPVTIKTLNEMDWAHGPFFLNQKIAVAPSIPQSWWVAVDNYIDLGTYQMMSVPYALFAGNASVTNVNTSIAPGPSSTFLITDSTGKVRWAEPQAAQQNVTHVSNYNMNLAIATGTAASIQPLTTSVVEIEIPGVKVGDPILVAPQGDYQNWAVYSQWVSRDGFVKIRFANYTDEVVDVKNSDYKIVVIK